MRGVNLTEKRLDRVVCNDSWLNFWSAVSSCTLTRNRSDHFPLLMDLRKENRNFSSSFKFLRMWASHLDCSTILEDAWKGNFSSCPMFILCQKLKQVKMKLKEWNKEIFGNVNDNVNIAMQKLDSIQQEIDCHDCSDLLINHEQEAQCEFQKALHFQEELWKEKSRMHWHTQGDRNTKLFS